MFVLLCMLLLLLLFVSLLLMLSSITIPWPCLALSSWKGRKLSDIHGLGKSEYWNFTLTPTIRYPVIIIFQFYPFKKEIIPAFSSYMATRYFLINYLHLHISIPCKTTLTESLYIQELHRLYTRFSKQSFQNKCLVFQL